MKTSFIGARIRTRIELVDVDHNNVTSTLPANSTGTVISLANDKDTAKLMYVVEIDGQTDLWGILPDELVFL